MKILNKMKFMSLLLTLVLVVFTSIPTIIMAAQPTVNLGTTEGFAVLAGSEITNTGNTVIEGSFGADIGLYPGSSFTGQASTTSGAIHIGDAVAIKAKEDLVTAYNDAAGRTGGQTIPAELGGQTLLPGVYDSLDGSFGITGTLTLDAMGDPNAVFIFRADSTLTTASDSKVNLINGARFCRTFWKVGSSATLGTNSYFVGHIFAMESITATTGATVEGQLLARNGAVTLDTNTIINGICEETTIITNPTTTPAIIYIEEPTKDADVKTPEIEVESPEIEVETPKIEVESPEIEVESPDTYVPDTDVPTPEIDVPIPQTGQETDYTWALILGFLALLLASAGAIPLVSKMRK